MISSPVSSPCAPAAGWKVTPAMPVTAQSAPSSSTNSCSAPWVCDSGCSGCNLRNPDMAAASSASLGLYFIEHEPSG